MVGVHLQRAVDDVVLVSGSGNVTSTMAVVTMQAATNWRVWINNSAANGGALYKIWKPAGQFASKLAWKSLPCCLNGSTTPAVDSKTSRR